MTVYCVFAFSIRFKRSSICLLGMNLIFSVFYVAFLLEDKEDSLTMRAVRVKMNVERCTRLYDKRQYSTLSNPRLINSAQTGSIILPRH